MSLPITPSGSFIQAPCVCCSVLWVTGLFTVLMVVQVTAEKSTIRNQKYNTRQRGNFHPNKTNLVLGGRTFKNSGRLAFNSLPSEIKEASSLAIFKRLLKGHFI